MQDQSHCTMTGFKTIENRSKPLVLKELKKLWEKLEPGLPWEMGDYDQTNTLLLDDSPYKALRNPVSWFISLMLSSSFCGYSHVNFTNNLTLLNSNTFSLFLFFNYLGQYCNFPLLVWLQELQRYITRWDTWSWLIFVVVGNEDWKKMDQHTML